MKNKPDLQILQGLLFTYRIENIINLESEKIITSKKRKRRNGAFRTF